MVRTLDADRNAELERRYSVSYGNDRGNRKNMQTGRSSGAAKNTRGTQTARRRKDTDAAGAVGAGRTTGGRTAASTARANSTGRTTGGRTAGSTARTSSTGRTAAASTARANSTGRTAGGSTARTAGSGRTTAASTARANNTGRTAGGSTVRTAGTGRTTGGSAARTVGTGRTTAASTARTSSTGRTTAASAVRTTGTARTAATVRTTGTSAVTRHAGTAGNAETARTARPAGTARTAGTVRSGRNINRNEQKRRIARETARGRGVRVDEASRTTTVPERRVRSSAMSFQSVIVMLALIVAMTVILVFYITLQAEVTGSSQQIANLEEQLTELKAENDASYNEITDSISLEEVRKKAIYELGMKYADRNQVVIYSGTEKDSVHQVSSLNDH